MENPYINPQTYYPTMNNGYASLRHPNFLLNVITQQDQPTRRILPFVTKEGISSRKCWSCWVIIRVHLAHDYTDESHQRRVNRSIKWPTRYAAAGRLLVGALPFVCSNPKVAAYFLIFQLLWSTPIAPLCINSVHYPGRVSVARWPFTLSRLCVRLCARYILSRASFGL